MADQGFDLEWHGDAILNLYRESQKAAVNEVAALCVVSAARDTPVITGLAQGSVRAEPARAEGSHVFTIWGSFDVDYYIFIELRTHPLRNAVDEHYGKLASTIRKFAKQARGSTPRRFRPARRRR